MNKRIFSKGIGLLELMLVLVIISMMTVAAVRYFSIVSASNRMGQAMEMVSAIRAAGERWKVGKDNYSALSAMSDFVNLGLLPNIYSSIKNPWGGDLTVAKNSADNTKLDIKFTAVPTAADCTNFTVRIQSIGCIPTADPTSCAAGSSVTATC